MRRSADPPPTEQTVRRGAWALATILALSASIRFVLRRRRTAAPARLAAIVDRNRSAFVRITIVDHRVFARWDGSANTYRTVDGIRVRVDDEERAVAAATPLECGPGMLAATLQSDESGMSLSAPEHATMWILARVVERRGEAGLRTGELAGPTLEPILDRFVIVRDENGPEAPEVYHPSIYEALLYPGVVALALLVFAYGSSTPDDALPWVLGGGMTLLMFEFIGWGVFFAPDRPRR